MTSQQETKIAPKIKLKVVVRRLPPNLPQHIFESTMTPFQQTITWSSYVPGKLAKSQAKEHLYSRAYLAFDKNNALLDFVKQYQGHVFQDSRNIQYQALVELAPFQKYIPAEKKVKVDQRVNTIEDDEGFKAFLEAKDKVEEQEEMIQIPSSTPLLDALRHDNAVRQEQRKKKQASQGNRSVSKNEESVDKKKKRNRKKNDASREGSKDGRSSVSKDGRSSVSKDNRSNTPKDKPKDTKKDKEKHRLVLQSPSKLS